MSTNDWGKQAKSEGKNCSFSLKKKKILLLNVEAYKV
jgi:hypothetical protein